jgi:transmembrane sensor
MSTQQTIQPDELRRLEEAGDWLLRLNSATHTEADVEEWLRWCHADDRNLAAYEALQRDWQDLDALKQLPVVKPVRRSKVAWALAAGVAAVALTFSIVQMQSPSSAVVTAAVSNRAATLPDGSKMILGAQSLVNLDFSGPTRKLDLSSGEAYFKVKHDRLRPFVVQAGAVSVTAVGTAFDVRRQDDDIVVTVEEGIVEVAGDQETWRAAAGYQLRYSNRRRTASIATVNPAVALAWRSGELAYVREPLGSVIEELNRYSEHKIVIDDPEIASLPFTGTAFAASLEDWLAGIEAAYPVSVRRVDDGEIVLSSR